MSSEDGNDAYSKSVVVSNHQKNAISAATLSASNSASVSRGAGSTGRRKSGGIYQQHGNTGSSCGINDSDIHQSMIGLTTYANVVSPNRYSGHHQDSGSYTLSSSNRFNVSKVAAMQQTTNDTYEEGMACCMPPPSPAPTSDRFVIDVISPTSAGASGQSSVHHYHDQRFLQQQQHHRTMSPRSRYRNTITVASANDIFRDISPKNDRFVTAGHFLANSTPMASTDSYVYMGATVHTPVKRYVPTPPPIFDSPSSTSVSCVVPSTVAAQAVSPQPQQQNGNNGMPYRFRVKCCGNDVQQQQSQAKLQQDQHATPPPPRTRLSSKCSNSSQSITTSTSTVLATSVATATINSNSTNTINNSNSSCINRTSLAIRSNTSNGSVNSTVSTLQFESRTPSIEYIGPSLSNTVRVSTPVSIISEVSSSTSISCGGNATLNNISTQSTAETCLHCNTIRRTTGVHQTTQTTEPISPIPLTSSTADTQQLNVLINDNNSSLNLVSPNDSLSKNSPSQQQQQQQKQCSKNNEGNLLDDIIVSSLNRQQQQQQSLNALSSRPLYIQKQSPRQQHQIPIQQPQPIDLSATLTLQRITALGTTTTNNQSPQSSNSSMMPVLFARQSHKQRFKDYVRREVARFFGVLPFNDHIERHKWSGRQHRLAIRCFGADHDEYGNGNFDIHSYNNFSDDNCVGSNSSSSGVIVAHLDHRPDILPTQLAADETTGADGRRRRNNNDQHRNNYRGSHHHHHHHSNSSHHQSAHGINNGGDCNNSGFGTSRYRYSPPIVERKSSVVAIFWYGLVYIIQMLIKRKPPGQVQWSRSFAREHTANSQQQQYDEMAGINNRNGGGATICDIYDGLMAFQEDEIFFDNQQNNLTNSNGCSTNGGQREQQPRSIYSGGDRICTGWRTRGSNTPVNSYNSNGTSNNNTIGVGPTIFNQQQQQQQHPLGGQLTIDYRGKRIAAHLLDGVLDNSIRPMPVAPLKLRRSSELDDRYDYRPFFTYWINTVQIIVLIMALVCYGLGPIGVGVEQRIGQVLVTSLSLQQVQHTEPRNIWIGPRGNDLVHLGAKFAACMRRDVKILDVIAKTRRQERETACCIRNDDSGCVQSSQADCSVSGKPEVRGLWPTSISTWKKWSPGDSGPGGRISGSVCGLDPKYCDAPASIAPYEWPDDITKWPICRKTNSFSQRFRFKDHTAEHMVCEVIGHPCCTGVYGECRITTREYCDFVNGYFHDEASLCSQVNCLNDVCGMLPFFSIDIPDQFYRLVTSLCLHAGILHLAITVAFQHIFLGNLERLIGPLRTSIVYIGSGVAGNLTSAIFVPYKAEVGPLASLAGVISSLIIHLIIIHWNKLKKPHIALVKLLFICATLFGIGTLSWQQNFAGLIAGLIFGIILTFIVVPFVEIRPTERKIKMNFIWICFIFNITIYIAMFVIFYIFPNTFTSIDTLRQSSSVNDASANGYGSTIVTCEKGSIACMNMARNNA